MDLQEAHYCEPQPEPAGRFGVKIPGSPRCLGYTLLQQRRSTPCLDWDPPAPADSGTVRGPGAPAMTPAVLSALEGVAYIAEHLRAEDADFSVRTPSLLLLPPLPPSSSSSLLSVLR